MVRTGEGLSGFLPEPTSQDSKGDVGENSSSSGRTGKFDIVRTCYEIGGMLGIDPTHLSFRDLLWMMEGKAELEAGKKSEKAPPAQDNVSKMKGIFNGQI